MTVRIRSLVNGLFSLDVEFEEGRSYRYKFTKLHEIIDIAGDATVDETERNSDIQHAVTGGYIELLDSSASGSDLTQLQQDLTDLEGATRNIHQPIVSPADYTQQPGLGPTPVVFSTVMGLEFDDIPDEAYRFAKIPSDFVGTPTFHIHWTKSDDDDESGNTVRWEISYVVFPGNGANINVAPTVLTVDDTYDDASTDTSRVLYRTANVAATGFVAGYYIGIRVSVDDGATTLNNNAVLVTCDWIYEATINQGT